ncbi:MAG TPA: histidinol-phosphatase HisJ family protein [Candidatus Limnocylindrales bacterium]|nr:histidinol-phosphatase HisJ family protein [Candidatus Limnocylindrales bacterium]
MTSAPTGPTAPLPLDAHVHTDQSPDSRVPIDVYAALAIEQGLPEIAITDHVDFDRRDPAWGYVTYADRERVVREAAERWGPRGVTIRFGVEMTWNTSWADAFRDHLGRHRYDYVIGSVHDWPGSPYRTNVGSWVAGRPLDEIVAPYYNQLMAGVRAGVFDTIGHLDVLKRYLHPFVTAADLAARPDLLEPVLTALVESGVALEVNTSGLYYPGHETYPSATTVARFRELGGSRVVAGSDAHRADRLAHRFDVARRIIAEAGFEALAFRRGELRTLIPIETPA